MNVKISAFLNEDGRITQFPTKHSVQLAVLSYLAEKFEPDRSYLEKEVNAICDEWHTFHDYFLLRRCLVDAKLLSRKTDGSAYWRTPTENKGGLSL